MRKGYGRGVLAAVMAMVATAPAEAVIPADADPVLYWNDVALGLVGGGPPLQARVIAILNTAIFDAVNNTSGGSTGYYVSGVSAAGGDTRAAVASAAHKVLTTLNPANAAAYDNALASSLALVADGTAKTNGIATGNAYASAMLALRANDGSTASVSYSPSLDPGKWRPTPPNNAAAALPQWGSVTPFLMTSGDQFRPDAPPALGSAEYATAYNEVKTLGAFSSQLRSDDQTASALFWNGANGLTWFRIGLDAVANDGLPTLENARVMAKLSTAVADSFIAGFDSKYYYNLWRPITAIREGDNDGNLATAGDAAWLSRINAPAHPSFLSTHSLQSAAAAAVLSGMIADRSFCATIGALQRCFTSFAQAAQDGAESRIWGGIHFRFDSEIGLAVGHSIGIYALENAAFGSVPEPSSWAMMILGFGAAGVAVRRTRYRLRYA